MGWRSNTTIQKIKQIRERITRTEDLDLVFVIMFVSLAAISVFLDVQYLRIIFGLPFILFLPGYTFISAVFPVKEGMDVVERLFLSFGLSIPIVALLGLLLNYLPFEIRLESVAVTIALFTLVCLLSVYLRRSGYQKRDAK